jgi:hypothetical protein
MQFKRLVWASTAVFVCTALVSCGGKQAEPTPDVNAIYTSAAHTMVAGISAQETKTAQAVSPTPKSSPTPLASLAALPTLAIGTGSVPFGTLPVIFGTPGGLPTSSLPGLPTLPAGGNTGGGNTAVGCDNSAFASETKPLDKAQISAGTDFTKGWEMTNNGTCTWGEGYSWSFVSGDNMSCNNVIYKANDATTAPGHSNSFIVHCTAPDKSGEYKGLWQMKNAQGTPFGVIPWVDIVVP